MLLSGPVGAHDRMGVWAVSLLTGTLRRLRDDVTTAAPSPDGSRIAFVAANRRELWTMGANGEDARPVVVLEDGSTFARVAWSADGSRLVYLRRLGLEWAAIESCDLDAGRRRVLLQDPALLNDFVLTGDGRILYELAEAPPKQMHSNLWEARIGPAAGALSGNPRRTTNLVGFAVGYPRASADGARITFVRSYHQGDVYLGDLADGGRRLAAVRRMTLDDRTDWPGNWSADGQAIYFFSDRGGDFDLYRQEVGSSRPELLVAGPGEEREPRSSHDGESLLYLAWDPGASEAAPATARLMRLPLAGGAPQPVLEAMGHPGSVLAQAKSGSGITQRGGHPTFRCVGTGTGRCVLSEKREGRLVLTLFDPVRGRGEELFRLQTDGAHASWDLSPDGTRIAVGRLEADEGSIRVVDLSGDLVREVSVQGWTYLDSVAWTAEGEALYVTSWGSKGSTLLRLDLDGNVTVLHQISDWIDRPTPSPDGRYLAFAKTATDSNVWLIER